MPMYNLIDTSGSSWQFKRDEVPADNADLTIDYFQSFKYKAPLVGKTADAVNNTNSSVKKNRNFCFIKVSKRRLEIIRNVINQLQISS